MVVADLAGMTNTGLHLAFASSLVTPASEVEWNDGEYIREWPWTSYHELVEGIIEPHLPRVALLEGVTIGEYVDIDEEYTNESGLEAS